MRQNNAGTGHADVEGDVSDFHCVTCSDEAVRVTVLSVDQDAALAWVTTGGVTGAVEEVDISLVDADAVSPGDILLAHGGVALTNLGMTDVK